MPTPATLEIRVLVAHADPLLGAGLASVLREQAGVQVYLGQGAPAPVDVTIADYDCALRVLTAGRPQAAPGARSRWMVLARQAQEHEVRQALEAGVHGYLVQGCRLDQVVEGVRALARGQRYLCPEVAQCVAESISHESLTAREREVLKLLGDGYCNKTIARELSIAIGTVKAHVKGILGKLDASSRTQAVSVAVARGLVRPAGRGTPKYGSEETLQ